MTKPQIKENHYLNLMWISLITASCLLFEKVKKSSNWTNLHIYLLIELQPVAIIDCEKLQPRL